MVSTYSAVASNASISSLSSWLSMIVCDRSESDKNTVLGMWSEMCNKIVDSHGWLGKIKGLQWLRMNDELNDFFGLNDDFCHIEK